MLHRLQLRLEFDARRDMKGVFRNRKGSYRCTHRKTVGYTVLLRKLTDLRGDEQLRYSFGVSPVRLSVYLCVPLSVCPSISVSVYQCVRPSVCPSISVSVYLCVRLYICLSVFISVRPSIYLCPSISVSGY